MTRLVCHEHGEVEHVTVNGYGLGHNTSGRPNELDLEGIEFTFSTDASGDVVLSDADGAESYLSDFADWEAQLIAAMEASGPELRECSECGRPTWLLDDGEEVPEP